MFFRGKAGSRVEFLETSDAMDQRTRQQCSQRQVIDANKIVDISLMDKFWQRGKNSEGIGIGFSCGVARKEAFSEDLFGEVEETRIAESGIKKRIPGYSDEVQTGTEVEFTEEVYDQIIQEISRAALIEYGNSGIRKFLTEKVIEWSVESCGPHEHHATEIDYVLSPESE